MKIRILKQDIEKALAEDCCHNISDTCPTAQALKRITGKQYQVGNSLVFFDGYSKYQQTEPLKDQVRMFTTIRKFRPGWYELKERPTKWQP